MTRNVSRLLGQIVTFELSLVAIDSIFHPKKIGFRGFLKEISYFIISAY